MKDWIQIAGIRSESEAELLLECGVDGLGFPLRLPVHKEDIAEEEAARIIRNLPSSDSAVLITYQADAEEIESFCAEMGASWIQLHGEIALPELAKLRRTAPGLRIIKSLVVKDDNLPVLKKTVEELAAHVDAFITDTYDPSTGASGATGKVHDWEVSRELVRLSPRPVILAGGLRPSNVREAILKVKPAGVDAHTGVEDDQGRKTRDLVRAFVTEAKAAFALLSE